MQIVRAKPEEADTLTEIAFAAKRHWGYPEHWIQSWRGILTMRPEFIAANIAYCAVEDGRPVGFYVLTTEGGDLQFDHLWVMPSAIGRGIGRALFEHAAAQAKAREFKNIKIEADPNAEAFYKHMGAMRVGIKVTEIEGKPRELPLLEYSLL